MLKIMIIIAAFAATSAQAETCERGMLDAALNVFKMGRNADCEWQCWKKGSWLADPECASGRSDGK